ncbi:hypothetical protein RHECNPAF_1260014 [Rhizobium etli CNPAF512]|nr:hypothetical protein RHECNPAF_1260014 [Rhizobium etli CNPAF512]
MRVSRDMVCLLIEVGVERCDERSFARAPENPAATDMAVGNVGHKRWYGSAPHGQSYAPPDCFRRTSRILASATSRSVP